MKLYGWKKYTRMHNHRQVNYILVGTFMHPPLRGLDFVWMPNLNQKAILLFDLFGCRVGVQLKYLVIIGHGLFILSGFGAGFYDPARSLCPSF
jgi:hypothetical protein